MALVVLGLTALALMLAFSTSISATQRHRDLATANIVLDSASQQVISAIEQHPNLFGCDYETAVPTTDETGYVRSYVMINTPANYGSYAATIASVQYWNAATGMPQTNCIPNSNPPLVVTVTVTGNGESYSNQFVVDLPSGNLGSSPDLSNGIASQLVFTGVPSESATGSSGVPFTPQPVVSVLDSNNQVVTTDNLAPIILSIEGNPANVSISGCTANDPDGIATYSGCTLTGTAGTYYVHATILNQGLDSDPSGTRSDQNPINPLGSTFWQTSPTWYTTTFAVTIAGAPDKVVFPTHEAPVAGVSGANLTAQPTIDIDTAAGVVDTTQNGTLTLTLTGGALVGCASAYGPVPIVSGGISITGGETITAPAHAGVVALTGCQFSGAIFYNETASPKGPDPTTYEITASYSNAASAMSPIFVTGPGSVKQLEFVTQPSGVSSTTSFATPWPHPFAVEVEDAVGNPVWTVNATQVTAVFTTGQHETLSHCSETSVADSATAVFSNCEASAYGDGLTLAASYSGFTATSDPFSISVDAVTLKFTTQPAAGPSGSAFTTQPVIEILDATGNVDTGWSGSINLAVTTPTPPATQTGTMTGCTGLTPNGGVATVATCLFAGNPGTQYTLTASLTNAVNALITGVSVPFTPSQAGNPTQLAFTTTPAAGAVAGSLMATQPVVRIEDSQGNVVTTSTATISLTSSGGTLAGCSNLTAVAGVVNVSSCTFGGLIGSFYSLTAKSPGLAPATSLLFSSNTAAGTEAGVLIQAIPTGVSVSSVTNAQLYIQVVDSWGNDAVSTGDTVLTVSSTSLQGFFNVANGQSGPLGVATTVDIPAGSSSISVYYGDETAGQPTITAYNNATVRAYGSTSLTINPAVPTQLLYTTAPPTAITAGAPFNVVVTEEDQYNNVVTTDSATQVTLSASNGTSNGGFSCTSSTVTVNAGVATFKNCTYTSASATPFTLTASSAGLTSATATTTVSAGAASRIVIWSGNNQSVNVTTAFASPLSVLVTDSSGNPVPNVTVTFTAPNNGATGTFLAATSGGTCLATGVTTQRSCKAITNSAGIATSLSFKSSATNGTYNVTATSPGLTTATFVETNTKLALGFLSTAQTFATTTTSPTTTSGSVIVQAQDGNGNPVIQATALTVNLTYTHTGTLTLPTEPASVIIPAGSSSASFTVVATSAAGTATMTVTAASTGYTSASQVENVIANATATTIVTVTGSNAPPGQTASFLVTINNTTTGTLYYEVSSVQGLLPGETAPTSRCLQVTGDNGTQIPEVVTTSANRPVGTYTLDFVVESFTPERRRNCEGATSFFQGDATLTVNAGASASIALVGGYGQIAADGTAFANPLSAVVTDSAGDSVAGVLVTFSSPTNGPGGAFLALSNGGTCDATGTAGAVAATLCTAMTNASGVTSSLTFSANSASGSYVIGATVSGATPSPLVFEEENQ